MSKGYVYVLANDAMPGLVKIGRTCRSAQSRADELYQTGVPTPFRVVAEAYSPDCVQLERMMHEQMQHCRVSEGREFFSSSECLAAQFLEDMHREQVAEWLQDFLPDHVPIESDMLVDPGIMSAAMSENGAPYPDAGQVYSLLTPEEIAPAIKRLADLREKMRGAVKQ